MEPEDNPLLGKSAAPNASKPHRFLAYGCALLVIIAFSAAFAAFQGRRPFDFALAGRPATRDGSLYHDPLGLFTMRLPPGWTASVTLGSFEQGDAQGSMSGQDESIRFANPALGAASPSLFVYAYPISNPALAQSMRCALSPGQPATFNGYPADESSPALVIFNSADAHYQIDETIPGSLAPVNPGGPVNPPLPPTPMPSTIVAADQALLQGALASFRPTNPHPHSCG